MSFPIRLLPLFALLLLCSCWSGKPVGPDTAAPEDSSGASSQTKKLLIDEETLLSITSGIVALEDQRNKLAPARSPEAQRLSSVCENLRTELGSAVRVAVYRTGKPVIAEFYDGNVRLSRGLIKALSDEELYAVVGHSLAHVKLGHTGWRIRYAIANAADRTSDNESASAIAAIAASLAETGYTLTQEKEADSYLLQFLARNGVDPRTAVRLLETLGSLRNGGTVPLIHPGSAYRATRLRAEIEQHTRRTEPAGESAAGEPTPLPTPEPSLVPPAPLRTPVSASTAVVRRQPPPADAGSTDEPLQPGWYVQLTADDSHSTAVDLMQSLRSRGFLSVVQRARVKGRNFSRVLSGPYRTQLQAANQAKAIEELRLRSTKPFLKEVRE